MKKLNVFYIFTTALVFAACGGGNQANNSADPGLATPLTTAETSGLQYMREEEELARDLYMDIFNNKGLSVFQTISQKSETQHAAQILVLLNTYTVADPSTGSPNTYTNLELQTLYNTLLAAATGATSTNLSALMTGALVEEVDISDINIRKAQVLPAHQMIIATYDNLLCGSRNHLRAFVAQIELLTGQPYVIQVPALAAEVNAILNGTQEQCGRI